MQNKLIIENIISLVFGIAVLSAGLINIFWGNDPEFGIFILLLSFVFLFPVNVLLKKITGISIPKWGIVKIILGLFIVWALLGVGELFEKIELMKRDLFLVN